LPRLSHCWWSLIAPIVVSFISLIICFDGKTPRSAMIEHAKQEGLSLRRMLRGIGALYPLALVAIAWEVTAQLGLIRGIFLPRLSAVITLIPKLAASGELIQPLLVSLYRAAGGLLLALVVGVTLGFVMARNRAVRFLIEPLVSFGFSSPKIAFLPIFILWFGIDHLSKILLVALTSVFPFIVSAYEGARNVTVNQLWAARAMGTSNTSLLRRVVLPASLPSLMSGLRIAVPYALMTAFTAEMIAGGGGLGGALVLAQRYFETPTVFAYILIMLGTGYILDIAFIWARKHILHWHEG
jgi:ABC-type nitrate/sulfonate/bicarbonate transport system permease component